MLLNGKVDMLAAFLPVLPNMANIKWGIELYHVEYVVLMKRPMESATGSGLLAPFEIEVWISVLILLLIFGPIIHGIMRLRVKIYGGSGELYSIGSCIWFVYGALMKQGSTLSPSNNTIRVIFATWWIFIVVLTSFYTANLTAFLTLSRFTLPIQGVEDIANPIYSWVAPAGGAVEYAIDEDVDLKPLQKAMKEGRGSYIYHNDHNKIKSCISKGNLLLYERTWLNHYMLTIEREVRDEKDHCKYVLTPNPYLSRSLSFAYQENSILPSLFDEAMLLYVESGIVKHLINKDIPGAVICPLNLGSKERKLRNSDLYSTYFIVIGGFAFATFSFFYEVAVFIFNKKFKKKTNRNRLLENNPRLAKCRRSLNTKYIVVLARKLGPNEDQRSRSNSMVPISIV